MVTTEHRFADQLNSSLAYVKTTEHRLILNNYTRKNEEVEKQHRCEKERGKEKITYLVIASILLFFTFSRKEVIYIFLIVPLFYIYFNKEIKLTHKILCTAVICILSFIFWIAMYEHTVNEVSEDYVRYQIYLYSLDIMKDYFPIGSGPGTFGSIFSMSYLNIYEAYKVPDRIVYGYSDLGRGPIFDMFLTSLLAEYGVGIFLYFAFLFGYIKKVCKKTRFLMLLLIFFIIYSAIMTPAFNTVTSIMVLACLSFLKVKKEVH